MSNIPLPSDMAAKWGNLPHLQSRSRYEWSSACPVCGTSGHEPSSGKPDRFMIFSADHPKSTSHAAYGKCRRCGHLEWLNDEQDRELTEQQIIRIQARRIAALEEEDRRKERIIADLQRALFWREWHDRMPQEARDMWHRQGISDYMINTHMLGFTDDRYADFGGAMTIPFLHFDLIQTLQYRLITPPNGNDKYRFEKGTQATWFYPLPSDSIGDVTLVLEGAKKAMVFWDRIKHLDSFTYQGELINVVATPSKNVPGSMIPDLEKAKLVIWLLDPDAYFDDKNGECAIVSNTRAVGVDKCRAVKPLMKIDDYITGYNLGDKAILNMIRQASPVRVS